VLGIAGLIVLIVLWIQAFKLDFVSVWILTVLFSLGSIKALGMVFFYDQFSIDYRCFDYFFRSLGIRYCKMSS